jgi:hypothetical protein
LSKHAPVVAAPLLFTHLLVAMVQSSSLSQVVLAATHLDATQVP